MYKLILVDDEAEVRKGILNKIQWDKYGFEIAGEAENGIEALEIAEKTAPDVVITDIKMPFMDGLTLANRIREKFPDAKILILTGFDEFEYAQKAIKLDVVEYILKPISSEELIKVLVRIKSTIDREIAEKKDMDALKEYYIKSLPLLREKFLEKLITTRLNREEIDQKSGLYGLHINGSGFIVSVANIDFKYKSFSVTSEDEELIKFAVHNITEEILSKHGFGIAFTHNDYIVILFCSGDDNKDIFISRVTPVLEEIKQSIKRYYEIEVAIGVGTFCSDIIDISYSYENAVTALDYRLILDKNRIIWIEDVEPQHTKLPVFDELKERTLVSCLKVGKTEEIRETVEKFFSEIANSKTSFNEYQVYLLEMLTAILKVAKNLSVNMDELFGDNYNLFVEMYKFKDLRDVKEWIISICIKIKAYVSQDRQDNCTMIVKNAVEYIQDNYKDSELTIDRLCSHLHISPAYFSTLFKKETKLTFVNYLTRTRMETARELLRSTSMKTMEIAKEIGYTEPNYFSYCFKKCFGISPTEYRNRA